MAAVAPVHCAAWPVARAQLAWKFEFFTSLRVSRGSDLQARRPHSSHGPRVSEEGHKRCV
eukprot:scaffold41398_cov76-Phaeocystis_antarctica.AAC.6